MHSHDTIAAGGASIESEDAGLTRSRLQMPPQLLALLLLALLLLAILQHQCRPWLLLLLL